MTKLTDLPVIGDDPAKMETTCGHWYAKYMREVEKNGELIVEMAKLKKELAELRPVALEFPDVRNHRDEAMAALTGLVRAVNTMTYPRSHPAHGVAVRVCKNLPRPYPLEVAVPDLLAGLRAALPHLLTVPALDPAQAESANAAVLKVKQGIWFGENGNKYMPEDE